MFLFLTYRPLVWESEEWLQSYGVHSKDRISTGVRAKSKQELEEDENAKTEWVLDIHKLYFCVILCLV